MRAENTGPRFEGIWEEGRRGLPFCGFLGATGTNHSPHLISTQGPTDHEKLFVPAPWKCPGETMGHRCCHISSKSGWGPPLRSASSPLVHTHTQGTPACGRLTRMLALRTATRAGIPSSLPRFELDHPRSSSAPAKAKFFPCFLLSSAEHLSLTSPKQSFIL